MCARLFYLLLAAFVIFNMITVAAFIYLPWWQAILTSVGTVIVIVGVGKLLLRYYLRRVFLVGSEMLNQQAKVLKGAQLSVHHIRPTEMPHAAQDLLEEIREQDGFDLEAGEEARTVLTDFVWREFELTIVPNSNELPPDVDPRWTPHSLCLVPEDWNYEDQFSLEEADDDGSLTLFNLQLIVDGEAQFWDDSHVVGMQRLRFVAGTPRQLNTVCLAYYTEKFGLIRLPNSLPPMSRS